MFIQHTAFLLNKGSQDRRRGILPPAVSIYVRLVWSTNVSLRCVNYSIVSSTGTDLNTIYKDGVQLQVKTVLYKTIQWRGAHIKASR